MEAGRGSEPEPLMLSVITERTKVADNRWLMERWQVLGVVAGGPAAGTGSAGAPIYRDEDGERYLWGGFELRLFRDEAEGYYYNLLGSRPSVFVVCRRGDGGEVVPVLTLASHYEAEAYMDAGEPVFAVPMPPEVYRSVERYVVENYVPMEKKGRKREQREGESG